MANSFEKESFIATGLEMVSYDDEETKNWRENDVIDADPISWSRPEDAFGAVEGDGSTGKKERCTADKVKVEKTEKEFTLLELYKYSDNIDEIISDRQKDGITLDPQELLKNLKGWILESRTRPQDTGKDRTDKTFKHPRSNKLRSTREVKEFVEAISRVVL